EFHAPDEVGIGNVAGDPGVEEIAKTRVEDNFRGRPRIDTAQNDGVRILTGRSRPLVVEYVARLGFPRSKSFVSKSERFQHLRRRQRRLFGFDRGEIATFGCPGWR